MSVQIKGSGTIGGIDEGLNVVGVTTLTGTGEYLLKLNKSDSSAVYAQFTNSTSGTSITDGFRIGMDSNEDGLVWLREDGNVKFGSNNLERLRINSDGKVGLGTTGSEYGLSIREADNNNKWLMLQKNSGQQLLQIREDGDNHVIIDGSHASGELHFYTAGSERLRIKSDGKVGVGTDSPLSVLTAYGENRGEGTVTGQITAKDNAAYNASPTAGIIFQGHYASNNAQAIFSGITGFKENANDGNLAGALAFHVRANGAVAYEALRITSAGRVGVGTVTPHTSYRFDIRHTSDSILHLGQGAATLAGMANNSWNAISFQGTNCEFGLYKDGSGDFSYIMGTYQGSTAIPLIFRTGNREERLRITNDGVIQAKTLSGSYYPIASVKDGSTSARAATSAWEIKKTLGPRAKTGYYYLTNPYDGTTNTWWCDMTTDGGGWILIAHTGEGQMSSLATGDGNHWFNRSNKGGFDSVGSGYYKGGGYWRATNGAWAANTCGQLMWDVRVHNQFGYQQYGYHDTAESNSKVVFNWGTDQALPNGASSLSNIPNANNRRFNEWCYEVQNAPGFNPNNYHQNVRSNVINGANYFTEHMVMTWSFRGTGGAGDASSDGPYWMIGSHHDGQHQHYEESLSGGDGVYGDGGYQVCSNQDTYWANNPSGTNQGMRRLAKIDDSGTVNVWLR